jgi:phosphate transport system substrate-binding protein
MYAKAMFIIGVLVCSAVQAGEEQIAIAGSTTVFPIIDAAQRVYAAAHPGVTFAVGQGGSGAGIEKAAKGDIALGMASREPNEAERKAYPELTATRIGLDGLALVVHAGNPVAGLTSAQVADIFCGKVTDWATLGGTGTIALVSEQENGGTLDSFKHHFKLDAKMDGEGAAKAILFKAKGSADWSAVRATRVAGTNQIIAAVVANPAAIGFASVAACERMKAKGVTVKTLAIDGRTASTAEIKAGNYTLTRPLMLISKGPPAGAAKGFVDFMLSADGQAVVAKADGTPNP